MGLGLTPQGHCGSWAVVGARRGCGMLPRPCTHPFAPRAKSGCRPSKTACAACGPACIARGSGCRCAMPRPWLPGSPLSRTSARGRSIRATQAMAPRTGGALSARRAGYWPGRWQDMPLSLAPPASACSFPGMSLAHWWRRWRPGPSLPHHHRQNAGMIPPGRWPPNWSVRWPSFCFSRCSRESTARGRLNPSSPATGAARARHRPGPRLPSRGAGRGARPGRRTCRCARTPHAAPTARPG